MFVFSAIIFGLGGTSGAPLSKQKDVLKRHSKTIFLDIYWPGIRMLYE